MKQKEIHKNYNDLDKRKINWISLPKPGERGDQKKKNALEKSKVIQKKKSFSRPLTKPISYQFWFF